MATYQADNKRAGQDALYIFCSNWRSAYLKLVKALEENDYILTFIACQKPFSEAFIKVPSNNMQYCIFYLQPSYLYN